jgi:hypothetical protein
MMLLNFSHPFTPDQLADVGAWTGQAIEQVIMAPAQFDPDQPFGPQLDDLLAHIPLTTAEWQTAPILVNLPALNVITAMLLAELHGRLGYFPPVLRLARVAGSLPPRYAVAEILNLQAVRDAARAKR